MRFIIEALSLKVRSFVPMDHLSIAPYVSEQSSSHLGASNWLRTYPKAIENIHILAYSKLNPV